MILNMFYLLLIMLILSYLFKIKTEHGFVYCKYPFAHKNAYGSLPNPKEVKRGYMWTPVSKLKKLFSETEKRRVYIDNFRFDEDYVFKSKMSGFFKKRAEKTGIFFDPLKMTQGILLIGKNGIRKN